MSRKILVVDDGAMNRSFVKAFFLARGYETAAAEDGLQALELAKSQAFDGVFSDIEMPNMNGLELLRSLKKLPQYAQVPVVMLSSLGQEDIIAKAKSYGASHYIVKPFTNESMEAALKTLGW